MNEKEIREVERLAEALYESLRCSCGKVWADGSPQPAWNALEDGYKLHYRAMARTAITMLGPVPEG